MTEMGRQPWVVYGQLKTADGVSPNSAGEVLTSLIVLTVLYGALAIIEVGLLLKYIKGGLTDEPLPSYGAARETGDGSAGDGSTGAGGAGEPMQLVY
jgi:cytochrome d ubiquinol oxidase subunit I